MGTTIERGRQGRSCGVPPALGEALSAGHLDLGVRKAQRSRRAVHDWLCDLRVHDKVTLMHAEMAGVQYQVFGAGRP
jgi:hypothetical protein